MFLSKFLSKSILEKIFAIDLRSLGVLRIGVGLILLTDILNRLQNLTAHYTNQGILPISLLQKYESNNPLGINLHSLSGEANFQLFLFALEIFFIILLIIGFKTKLATIISWVLLVSLHNRNPLILNGGDQTLRILLFWAIFLPWGDTFSLDSLFKPAKAPKDVRVFSPASVAFFLQIVFIYFFAFLHKILSPDWLKGEAVSYALYMESSARGVALYMRQYSFLLQLFTYFTLIWEGLGALLLLVPRLRIFAIAGLILMHLGFLLFLKIGLFPISSIILICALLPSSFWKHVNLSSFHLDKFIKEPRLERFKTKIYKLNEIFFSRIHLNLNLPFVLKNENGIFQKLINILVMSALIWVFWFNLSMVHKIFRMPNLIINFGNILQIKQYWNMFSKFYHDDTGNFQETGIFTDGNSINLYEGLKPASLISDTYKDENWRIYFYHYARKRAFQSALAKYLCFSWNKNHPIQKINKVRLFYKEQNFIKPRVLFTRDCDY